MTDVLAALSGHPVARDLDEGQRRRLVKCAWEVRYEAGQFIFREGGASDTIYLLLTGRVVLQQHVPGQGTVQLESLTGGDLLGISWIFPEGHWTLDARAAEPVEALALDAACIRAECESAPDLNLALAKHLIGALYQRLMRVRLQRLDIYAGRGADR